MREPLCGKPHEKKKKKKKKKIHPFKSSADLFNTHTILQAWVMFLAFCQIITYNASLYDIIDNFNLLMKRLNHNIVQS